MLDWLFNLFFFTALIFTPTLIAIWFFGLRRYIRRHGKTAVGAANWGLSMWADWTVAYELGRDRRKMPFCVTAFFLIHLLLLIEVVAMWIYA